MTTFFDDLPIELLHMIFQYLSTDDVIWTFLHLSPYLNSILNQSSWFYVDFQCASKSRFDFICKYLAVEQLHSLTLSDDFQTPGQVQLFFTHFRLRDLLNLQSLTLRAITNDDLALILSDLPKLNKLKRLITTCRSRQPLFLGQMLNQLKSLEHLSVSHGDIFDHSIASPLHHLKVLNAGFCTFLELCRLQFMAPSLTSLTIHLQANHQLQLLENSKIWSSLQQLNLMLDGKQEIGLIGEICRSLDQITFNEMKRFLGHFQNLNSLTLNIRGLATDLADGKRWEMCSTLERLQIFHFLFEFTDAPVTSNRLENEIFTSFSGSFWRETKKWYVVLTTHYICRTSCFNDQLFPSCILPLLSTSPDHRWFYNKMKQVKIIPTNPSVDLHQFPNLVQLNFSDAYIPLSILGYTRLRHLIFHQSIAVKTLDEILRHHPYIDRLTLAQNDVHHLSPWKSIRYLYFQDSVDFKHRAQIKELSRVFPSIRHLLIHLHSNKFIASIIDSFYHLENGIFELRELSKPISSEWLRENTRLHHDVSSFTCRNESKRFLVWISNTVSYHRSISTLLLF